MNGTPGMQVVLMDGEHSVTVPKRREAKIRKLQEEREIFLVGIKV